MTIAIELQANADPSCIHCEGEGFVVCEGDDAELCPVICDCVSEESISDTVRPFRFSGGQSPYPAFSPLDIPKVGAEICVAQTVMLTNPDYLSDELPTWENDSADFNPISLLFGDRD